MVLPGFEMRGQLGRNLSATASVRRLEPFAYTLVKLLLLICRGVLAPQVLIQSMAKTVTSRTRAIGPFMRALCLDKVVTLCKTFTYSFYLDRVNFRSRGYCGG